MGNSGSVDEITGAPAIDRKIRRRGRISTGKRDLAASTMALRDFPEDQSSDQYCLLSPAFIGFSPFPNNATHALIRPSKSGTNSTGP